MFLVSIASLLHDVDDYKLVKDRKETDDPYLNAKEFMNSVELDEEFQKQVIEIISSVSFKANETVTPKTIEGKIVQDADRLDAIGAIGCTTIVDSVGNALKATFKNHPLFIKPNDQELGDLIGHKVTTDEEIIAGGLELLDQGPQNVVVSMGGRGSFFFAKDKSVYFISAAKGYKFINPVGTGDSSIAGFIKGIVEKQDIVTCMKWMAAAASSGAAKRT